MLILIFCVLVLVKENDNVIKILGIKIYTYKVILAAGITFNWYNYIKYIPIP